MSLTSSQCLVLVCAVRLCIAGPSVGLFPWLTRTGSRASPWRSVPCRFGIQTGTIAADDLHAGMCAKPLFRALCTALRQKVNHLAMLQVAENRTVRCPLRHTQSSMPSTRGAWAGSTTTLWRNCRSSVEPLARMPSCWAKRAPAAPPKTHVICSNATLRRVVRRAHLGAVCGNLSVNISCPHLATRSAVPSPTTRSHQRLTSF